jgi:hypothetical protein
MEAWMGSWNGTAHSFTYNRKELGTEVETQKRQEVVFNKIRGGVVFYFMENEVTCNICKKGSYKTISLHLLVQQRNALEIALGCHLEVIRVPGTIMIAPGTGGLSRVIWINGLNTDFKSFTVEVLLPALPYVSLTKCALNHIGIIEE